MNPYRRFNIPKRVYQKILGKHFVYRGGLRRDQYILVAARTTNGTYLAECWSDSSMTGPMRGKDFTYKHIRKYYREV